MPPLARRAVAAALVALLSQRTGHAAPPRDPDAPASPRDLAYDAGVRAEEAGDLAAAGAAYERAYRLTPPGESGPRLLFLRASVAARLRAADGARRPETELCPARELLREFLGPTAPAGSADPLADERASLSIVERRLDAAGRDCAPDPPDPAPPVPAPSPEPAPAPTVVVPTVVAPPAAPDRGRLVRDLRISGGVALGLGAVGFAILGGGVALARDATARGLAACRDGPDACITTDAEIRDIRADGELGDRLVTSGAVLGGLLVAAGVSLLAVSARRPRARPTVAPAGAGLVVSGRF
jgi:hypothetical protein